MRDTGDQKYWILSVWWNIIYWIYLCLRKTAFDRGGIYRHECLVFCGALGVVVKRILFGYMYLVLGLHFLHIYISDIVFLKCIASSSLGQDFPMHFMILCSETRKRRQSEFSTSTSLAETKSCYLGHRPTFRSKCLHIFNIRKSSEWKDYGHGPII